MKLLFDQNISFKVAKNIQPLFPGSKHLSDLRIEGFKDIEIWHYAKANDFSIVTYDFDFIDLATLKGFPPKIIWLRTGNASTEKISNKFFGSESSFRLSIQHGSSVS
jgi:predicted nuclease of predicted toxin-antitoxin system